MASFIQDIDEIRQRAINKIEDGPVTDTYRGDKNKTVQILNEALATEIVCVLRYLHHYFMATGVHGRAVADEFKEHADEEREHADELAERIQQLGGKPDFNPASLLQRSVSQYAEGESLADMIREDLIAERMVIEVYQRMIRHFADNDPTTRRLIEHILEEEEEHAAELSDLLFVVDPESGETEGRDPGTNPLELQHKGGNTQSRVEGESYDEDEEAQYLNRRDAVRGRDREYDGRQEARSESGSREGNRREGRTERTRQEAIGDMARPTRARRQEHEIDPDDELGGNLAHSQVSGPDRDARRQEQGRHGVVGESRPARYNGSQKRAQEQPFAGRGSVKAPASNIGGVGGRTMNRRKNEAAEIDTDDVAESPRSGASRGGTRSPKLIQKNRKNKKVA